MSGHEYGLYMYGITGTVTAVISGMVSGIDDTQPLVILPLAGYGVLISYVDLSEYGTGAIDKHLQDMKWVKEKTQRHFQIIHQLARQQLLLPMKFCTIFVCEENLKQFIFRYQKDISWAFKYFFDKEEWTIKLYCNQNNFIEQNMDEERKELHGQAAGLSPGKAYFFRKQNAVTLEEQSRDKINNIKNRIWEELIAVTEKVRINKNLSHQITERKEEMILNAAFLIKKENLTLLMTLGEKLDKQLTGLNMYAELVGPWPFYNFTELFIQEQEDKS